MISQLARIFFLFLVFWALRKLWSMLSAGLASSRPVKRKPVKRKPESAISAHEMIQDPNCGTYVLPTAAIRIRHSGRDLYFCSQGCEKKYRASHPEITPQS